MKIQFRNKVIEFSTNNLISVIARVIRPAVEIMPPRKLLNIIAKVIDIIFQSADISLQISSLTVGQIRIL